MNSYEVLGRMTTAVAYVRDHKDGLTQSDMINDFVASLFDDTDDNPEVWELIYEEIKKISRLIIDNPDRR